MCLNVQGGNESIILHLCWQCLSFKHTHLSHTGSTRPLLCAYVQLGSSISRDFLEHLSKCCHLSTWRVIYCLFCNAAFSSNLDTEVGRQMNKTFLNKTYTVVKIKVAKQRLAGDPEKVGKSKYKSSKKGNKNRVEKTQKLGDTAREHRQVNTSWQRREKNKRLKSNECWEKE